MKTLFTKLSGMFKIFICLIAIVISTFSFSKAQVRIAMVDAFASEITLHNYGPAMVDISSWWLCAYASTYHNVADTINVTVQSGSLMIPPSGQVVLYWPTFTPSGADISLYNFPNFPDTSSMEDFMQWNGSFGRESVAVAKGIWTAGTWVNAPAPFTFIGGANDHGATFWINGCSGFAATANATNASCNGCMDGSATISVTGGVPPYTYNWTPVGGTNATAVGLGAGTYSCTVMDANGCSAVDFATVNEPGVFFIDCSVSSPIACVGDSGSVTAATNGGTAPFSYSWTSGDTTATTGNLPPGGYTCVVTDANALTASCFITLFQATPINSGISTSDPTSFCAGNSALLEAVIDTGYSYQWKRWGNPLGGATGSSFTAYGKGNFTVCITNSNGCTAESNTIFINRFPVPPAFIFTGSSTAFCPGQSAKLVVNHNSGNTYQWFRKNLMVPGATDTCYEAKGNGNHYVIVTDINGCTNRSNGIYTKQYYRPAVTVSPGVSPILVCPGDTVVLTALPTGGTPGYTYQWYRWAIPMPGETASTFTSILNFWPGTKRGGYRVWVTDANGCVRASKPHIVINETCPSRIEKPGLAFDLDLNPNPVTNELFIHLNTESDLPIMISISDMTGRLILKENYYANESNILLYLQSLEQGVYIINAVQGENKISKKIMKTN